MRNTYHIKVAINLLAQSHSIFTSNKINSLKNQARSIWNSLLHAPLYMIKMSIIINNNFKNWTQISA